VLDCTMLQTFILTQFCSYGSFIIGAKLLYEDQGKPSPSMRELLALREDPVWDRDDHRQMINNQGLLFLVSHIFGSIIGKRQWNKDKFNKKSSEVMTTSDEAFVLLVIENNWDILNDVENAQPKYTSKKSTSNRKNDGWNNEGIVRYNELVAQVKKNRKETFADKVEEEVMMILYGLHNGEDARKKREIQQDDNIANGKKGSISKKKKKHSIEDDRALPIIELDSSDGGE